MKKIEFEDALVVKPAKVSVLDEMPVGSVIDFDGTEVPAGWEEVYDENEKSFAQMHTNKKLNAPSGTAKEYDIWGSYFDISEGKFYCDASNKCIVIPPGSAEYVEISGHIAGAGHIVVYLSVFDNTKLIKEVGMLYKDGVGYKGVDISNMIIKLPDKSKTHNVKMFISGYGDEVFRLNDGFADDSTYMTVKKIK